MGLTYKYSNVGVLVKNRGRKVKIKKIKVVNQTLNIYLTINKKLRLKNNEERMKLLQESIENLEKGIRHFINVSSNTYNFKGYITYNEINKIVESIKIFINNELILEISLLNKFSYNMKYYELEDIKITVKYNILNYSKDRRERLKFDNSLMLLYALSIMLKNYYKNIDSYSYLYEEKYEVDKYIEEHIDDILLSKMTWRT